MLSPEHSRGDDVIGLDKPQDRSNNNRRKRTASKGGSSTYPSQPTEWSEWILDPGGRGYYCWRTSVEGQTEYAYHTTTPRSSVPAAIDGILDLSNHTTYSNTYGGTTDSLSTLHPSHEGGNGSPLVGIIRGNAGSSYANIPTVDTQSSTASAYNYKQNVSIYPYGQSSSVSMATNPNYSSVVTYKPNNSMEDLSQQFASTSSVNSQSNVQQLQQINLSYGLGNPTSTSKGTGKEAVPNEPNFKIRHPRAFKFGLVIKVLWSEPKGVPLYPNPVLPGQANRGEMAHTKMRRFVVIWVGKGHCQCLPILTYGGQATQKAGVVADEHVAVYTERRPTESLPTFPGEVLSRTPLRVLPNTPRDMLDVSSRLHLTKLYTVEFNIKVAIIGVVAPSDLDTLKGYFKEAWLDKF
ncbi:hypothetical protein HYFRA_00013728 [Hymenoscyphus fraxineus]|uniref:DUF6590 domain-containing protein n=1 Tax=Hymenoscyphus fraxineus TaxID=746836 RepID=A0A9N9LCG3_9HELO|nr:hypothetical protein HYFRA_00013728 [Hymenoscyphus fraxineus]